ncbi:hypothetical protein LTR56_028237 [Elasticomyces elasticus]|nr:hypothetical protein LTR56_028237 [Elasticomyces elasticus]
MDKDSIVLVFSFSNEVDKHGPRAPVAKSAWMVFIKEITSQSAHVRTGLVQGGKDHGQILVTADQTTRSTFHAIVQLLPYLEKQRPPSIWYADLMPKVSAQYHSQPLVQAYDFLIMEDKTSSSNWVNMAEARQLSGPFTTIPLSIQSDISNVVREKRVSHRQGFSFDPENHERTYLLVLKFPSRDFANSFKDPQRAETDFEGHKFAGFAWGKMLYGPIRSLETQGQITLRHFSVDLESAAPDTPGLTC